MEGHEPVAQLVEKWKAFHLRESTEINVSPSLLHLRHLPDRILHLLHRLVCGSWIENILQRIVFHLLYTILSNTEIAMFHQVWHNIAPDFLGISISIHAVHHLHLQFKRLALYLIVTEQFLQIGINFRKERHHVLRRQR